MAGTLIVSNLKTDTDNSFIVRSNTGTTLFVANTTGIDVANSFASSSITSDKILTLANTKISGNIISSQITSVANTQISGNIISSQIASVNGSVITANTIANSAIQTGAVENYMRAVNLNFGLRNRIINGQMTIDQRNSGASYSAVDSTYGLDRWKLASYDSSAQTGKYTVIQSSTAPAGFPTSMLITSSAATTINAGSIYWIGQMIEGSNTADLDFGKATAKSVTISFWVRSSLTGTFGGVISNSASNRSYPFSYTINSANTFEFKTVTIPGDTSGTWLTTIGIGIRLIFNLGSGTTYQGTANAWSGSQFNSVTGTTSLLATNGATLYIAGVQLEEGSQATPFEYRHHGNEFFLCQRYFQTIKGSGRHFIAGNGSVSGCFPTAYLKVTMRDTPSVSFSSVSHFTIEGLTGGGQSPATGLSINAVTQDTVTIQALASAGSTSATAAQVFGNGSAITSFSSEL